MTHDRAPKHWRDAFQTFRREIEPLAADLSRAQFNAAPEPGAWSVGQCLDHLNETGGQLVPHLKEALATAPAHSTPARAPRLRWYDRLFVWSMAPGGWLKVPAPGAYVPAEGALDPEQTLQAFRALQDELAGCAEAAEGVDWSAVKVASPASQFLRLSAGGWLAGTLAHQRRHFAQAQRAKAAVRGR